MGVWQVHDSVHRLLLPWVCQVLKTIGQDGIIVLHHLQNNGGMPPDKDARQKNPCKQLPVFQKTVQIQIFYLIKLAGLLSV